MEELDSGSGRESKADGLMPTRLRLEVVIFPRRPCHLAARAHCFRPGQGCSWSFPLSVPISIVGLILSAGGPIPAVFSQICVPIEEEEMLQAKTMIGHFFAVVGLVGLSVVTSGENDQSLPKVSVLRVPHHGIQP